MTPATVCARYRAAQALLPTRAFHWRVLVVFYGAFAFVFILWS